MKGKQIGVLWVIVWGAMMIMSACNPNLSEPSSVGRKAIHPIPCVVPETNVDICKILTPSQGRQRPQYVPRIFQ